mgnify:CR=1 FL=1
MELATSFNSPSLVELAAHPSRFRLLAKHRCGLQFPHATAAGQLLTSTQEKAALVGRIFQRVGNPLRSANLLRGQSVIHDFREMFSLPALASLVAPPHPRFACLSSRLKIISYGKGGFVARSPRTASRVRTLSPRCSCRGRSLPSVRRLSFCHSASPSVIATRLSSRARRIAMV